jgi:uncharacterized protein (TIRG00374 family)
MTSQIKSLVVQVVGVGLAIGLLYLALRNVDFDGMWRALEVANYWWLVPIAGVMLTAHFLRAWRWRMFLDALPESESSAGGKRVELKTAFYAVMIGYLLNMVIPRLGEVARAANLSSQSGLRFSSVFGTVVVERLLDFVAFLLILMAVAFVLAGSPAADEILFDPLQHRLKIFSLTDLGVVIAVLAAAVALLMWARTHVRSRKGQKTGLLSRLGPILRSFRLGFITLFTSPHRVGIAVTTVSIWFCYFLMLFIPLHMLHMAESYGLGLMTGLVLLGIGSIGFVLPAPGGIGAYHYFVIETFVQIYNVPYDVAAGFAVLTHTAQVVLLTVVGFACVIAQGSSFGSVLKAARDVESNSSNDPILSDGTE